MKNGRSSATYSPSNPDITPTQRSEMSSNTTEMSRFSSGPSHSARPRVKAQHKHDWSTHSEAWRSSWGRGQHEWELLAKAQLDLGDMEPIPMPFWQSSFWETTLAPYKAICQKEFCAVHGILQQFSNCDVRGKNVCNSFAWKRCDHEFRQRKTLTTEKRIWEHYFQIDVLENEFMINNMWTDEAIEVNGEVFFFALEIWPQLAFATWKAAVEGNTNGLQHVMFGPFSGDKAIYVLDDIMERSPNLARPLNLWTCASNQGEGLREKGSAPTTQYTPADDNFYALLGTDFGVATTRMLQWWSNTFATRDSTEAVRKVKSIRQIDIAASTASSGWDLPHNVAYNDLRSDMIFTLEDIDAP